MQIVNKSEAAMRLDHFLGQHVDGLSRRAAREAIDAGQVRVNGRHARKSAPVAPGDVVEVADEALVAPRPAPSPDLAIDVVYEDSALVVVDKPAGLPTLARRDGEEATVASFLVGRFPDCADAGDVPLEAGIVHRLDNDTSGLLVAARTPEAYRNLRRQFAERQVVKEYTALVEGLIREEGWIRTPIAPERRRRDQMRASENAPGARPAETHYRPLQQVGRATLLAVRIRTGVRHQIRVHLASIGHPIVGDVRYGARVDPAARRQMLHACYLELDHPVSGTRLDLRSGIPADFNEAVRRVQGRHGRRR
jgi:23S rRNA pseudouridine1911/1915/1917 synthase